MTGPGAGEMGDAGWVGATGDARVLQGGRLPEPQRQRSKLRPPVEDSYAHFMNGSRIMMREVGACPRASNLQMSDTPPRRFRQSASGELKNGSSSPRQTTAVIPSGSAPIGWIEYKPQNVAPKSTNAIARTTIPSEHPFRPQLTLVAGRSKTGTCALHAESILRIQCTSSCRQLGVRLHRRPWRWEMTRECGRELSAK